MNPLLDTVEPCGWINQRGDYVEVARKDTVYGSHTIPLYSRPKVESLLAECRKEARKEALLEAAENAPDDGCERYLRRMAEGGKE